MNSCVAFILFVYLVVYVYLFMQLHNYVVSCTFFFGLVIRSFAYGFVFAFDAFVNNTYLLTLKTVSCIAEHSRV